MKLTLENVALVVAKHERWLDWNDWMLFGIFIIAAWALYRTFRRPVA